MGIAICDGYLWAETPRQHAQYDMELTTTPTTTSTTTPTIITRPNDSDSDISAWEISVSIVERGRWLR
jgi:hypothetical protein